MRKLNKHIEIVSSSVKSLSSMSEKSYLAIQDELSKKYKHVGITLINKEEDLQSLIDLNPDLVFLGIKRVPRKLTLGDSAPYIWISDFLESYGIACTGSKSFASSIEEDKVDAKNVINKSGLVTADFYLTYPGQHVSKSQLPLDFPVFIKPPNLGGGRGIDDYSVVYNFKDYKNKLKELESDFNSEALVEKYLSGREFTVSILKNKNEGYKVMPLEIVAQPGYNGVKILGSNVKLKDTEKVIKVDNQELNKELSDFALAVFEALGARDYGRIDVRMDDQNVPHFLEANLIPSLIEDYGNFYKACKIIENMDYGDMLNSITNLGFSHQLEIESPQVTNLKLATN